MNETYLVTGAAGFIGYFLSKRLLREGKNVIGIDNLNDYYDVDLKHGRLKTIDAAFVFHRLDICNKDEIFNIFDTVKPEIVIHLAAQAGVRYSIENPDAYIQSNVIFYF